MKRKDKSITKYQIAQYDRAIKSSFNGLTFPRVGDCQRIDPKRVDLFMRKLEGLAKSYRRRELAVEVANNNVNLLGLRGFYLLSRFLMSRTGEPVDVRLADGYLINESDKGYFRSVLQLTMDGSLPDDSEANLVFLQGLNGTRRVINRLNYKKGRTISRRDLPFGEGIINAAIHEKGYSPYNIKFEIAHLPVDKVQFHREWGYDPSDADLNRFTLLLKPVF